MPSSQQNVTNIPSNRVDFIDPKTGLVSREWYRFFLNLFSLAGSGGNQTSLEDLQVGPPAGSSSGGGTGTVTSVDMTVPTGLAVSGNPITTAGTLAVTYASGYAIPTTAKQTQWDTAYTNTLHWDGGATSLVAATGRTSLGGTTVGQNFFTLTNPSAITFVRINADNSVSALDAATFRTAIGAGTGSGTVTSVTGTSPVVSSGGATPAISLASGYGDTQNPYASKTANYVLAAPNGSAGVPTFRALVSADIPALSYVSSIGVSAPITSTGGLTPTIGITQATTSTNGYLSSTDWNTFNGKQAAGSYLTAVSVASANGFAGTSSGGTTPSLTLSTSITGLLKGNGTAISAATAGTDYSAGTSSLGTGILKSTTTTGALSIAVAADFPTLNQNTTGTASNVTGTVAIANGGSGQTTAQAAMNAFAGSVTSGSYLRGNGTNVVMSSIQAADVPTLNQNTTGTASNITATSNSTLTTLSALSLPGSQVSGNISGNAANVTGTVAVANGGTGLTSLTANYIPYGNGTGAYSSSSQLQYNGTYLLVGAAAALGGLTNPVAAFTGNPGTTNYVQTYVYNSQNGISSSADLVAYANNSTDAHGWADMGFTSQTYADATYTVTGANEAYLFGSAPSGAGASGNLVYATDSTGSTNAHQFYVGGFTQAKSAWRAQITSTLFQTKGSHQFMGSTSGYVGLQAAAVAGSTTYTLPSADGTTGQALTTNGSGTLSWSTPSGSSNITSQGLWENSATISSNYTITSGNNAMSAGKITIASGAKVTVPSGSRWVIL